MAPIKLEDNMKERLEERTIEPTMAAWDKISSKLDAEQGAKKNKRVLWMSIAASFVGGALITLFVFQNMDTTTTSPVMVETEGESIFIDPIEEVKKNQKDESLQVIEDVIVQEEITTPNQELKSDKQDVNVKDVIKQKTTVTTQETGIKNDIAQIDKEEKNPKQESVIVMSEVVDKKESVEIIIDKNLDKAIAEKVEEVVAQVENKESITDAEIEELLRRAQREIISKQIFNPKTNKVDANALLLDVEAEVAPASFRNKIFEAVVEGFEKTRDAVANRNN